MPLPEHLRWKPSEKRDLLAQGIQNVGTGGDPSDDEYPGGDDDDDDDDDDDPEPSGDETPKEQEACERCRRLERVEACVPQKGKNTVASKVPLPRRPEAGSSRLANLENDIQALKEGFVDMVQGQHELTELVRDSAATTDQRLQALERRFSNLEGTLVNLMRVALGVKEGEGEEQEKEAPKESDSEEEEE
ncbi:hypothetical protein EV360DRAFT_91193 [Lentinula raphanica]|nr:hypothetical protein EV360DRAFT_91193 [Lentinula raphanica]